MSWAGIPNEEDMLRLLIHDTSSSSDPKYPNIILQGYYDPCKDEV